MQNKTNPERGQLMAREAAEVPSVFASAVVQTVIWPGVSKDFRAIYTIARGSSDAAANILAYEFMAQLGIPATSLPPSVFSIGNGVNLKGSLAVIISQSGASDDLIRAARGARENGGIVVAITNVEGSPVEKVVHLTTRINAGPELAVPATKSVVGGIAAGMALLAAIDPKYATTCENAAAAFAPVSMAAGHPADKEISAAFLRSQHIYIVGRGTTLGAAQEVALKLKETCILHAEAYSASEVLHGPLQLVSNPLLVVILDSEEAKMQDSLNIAEERFRAANSTVFRLRPSDIGAHGLGPAAGAAALLHIMYPIILATALSLGLNPDAPTNLAKITRTL